jgi:glycosyltransferase involved in cell wall biosynthesis
MRIALVAPPFICVPPERYGGTELFIAELAVGLKNLGHEPVVYTNGESSVPVERRWLYPKCEWPISGEIHGDVKDINHCAWAVADAQRDCDIIHVNNIPGLACSRFVGVPMVYTMHHPHDRGLSEFYCFYPDVHFVTISDFQQSKETLRHVRTIHHGLDFNNYKLVTEKQDYVAFIGRIAPVKGTHLAIAAAKKAGVPLKIAGEIQPLFRDYYEREVEPHIDGRNVEYVGEADLAAKNELLGNASAMLFPIQWDEPFGFVTIESMACGTPVIAFPGGSVREIVQDGVSGWVCDTVEHMAERIPTAKDFDPRGVRAYAERTFSLEEMVRGYERLYVEILSARAAKIGRSRAIA